ncbi:transposable element tc3 transposase, partial [Penicillium maclennaniae]|uniref:transposable element tc3 transposase n=1 Tax=Penicillium maclennaniae TaxID=1343394 RepID=UPI0025411FF8
PHSARASRDTRIAASTLRDQHYTYAQIASQLGITQRQVQKACTDERPTPRKPRGQRRKLSEDKLDELPVSKNTLRRALARRGYHRCKALRKPPLSDRTRALRLTWALEHVLWTDETWVISIYHRRIYVTRRSGEEFDDTYVRERISRAPGWMFWGSFYGNEKGPCLFWEKEWGTITSARYTERIVPLIHGIVTMARDNNKHLIVMQDGAPSHRDLLTIEGRKPQI